MYVKELEIEIKVAKERESNCTFSENDWTTTENDDVWPFAH